MAYSQDNGLTWTSILISNLENINGIAKNSDTWVALGKPETSSPEYSMMYQRYSNMLFQLYLQVKRQRFLHCRLKLRS